MEMQTCSSLFARVEDHGASLSAEHSLETYLTEGIRQLEIFRQKVGEKTSASLGDNQEENLADCLMLLEAPCFDFKSCKRSVERKEAERHTAEYYLSLSLASLRQALQALPSFQNKVLSTNGAGVGGSRLPIFQYVEPDNALANRPLCENCLARHGSILVSQTPTRYDSSTENERVLKVCSVSDTYIPREEVIDQYACFSAKEKPNILKFQDSGRRLSTPVNARGDFQIPPGDRSISDLSAFSSTIKDGNESCVASADRRTLRVSHSNVVGDFAHPNEACLWYKSPCGMCSENYSESSTDNKAVADFPLSMGSSISSDESYVFVEDGLFLEGSKDADDATNAFVATNGGHGDGVSCKPLEAYETDDLVAAVSKIAIQRPYPTFVHFNSVATRIQALCRSVPKFIQVEDHWSLSQLPRNNGTKNVAANTVTLTTLKRDSTQKALRL